MAELPDIDGPWANVAFNMRNRMEQSSVELDYQLGSAQVVRSKVSDACGLKRGLADYALVFLWKLVQANLFFVFGNAGVRPTAKYA